MSEEPNKVIYSMHGVTKRHGKKVVFEDINLSYFYGAKIGVVGLNGAGKSSLMRILAGEDTEFEGETHLAPGHTIGFLHQEPQLAPEKTVREIVDEAVADTLELLNEFERLSERLGESLSEDEMMQVLERQGEVQERLEAANAWQLDSRMEQALDALRCPSGETPVEVLSGGEKRRVALCRLLLQKPDILLLDEPTNHLDAETIAWLEQHLQRYPGTVIAVTHDRYFLDDVAGWILELDRGRGIPWRGNYASWLEQKRRQLAEEGREGARQEALARELEWIQGKAKRVPRNTEGAPRPSEAEIYIPDGPRLGEQVIEASGVGKGFGDHLLIDGLTFSVRPGAKVGLIGPNGAGKTTLFRMITGAEQPDVGSLWVGDTVRLAHVEQSRERLDPDQPAWEAMAEGEDPIELGPVRIQARAYAARFGFTGPDQQKPVRALSGGEQNRLHLARILKSGANVILLDEPTNDLDVNTMRALEEGLLSFGGCVLVISHDRWFLDRIATDILAFEGDSQVRWFQGNYSEYEADRRARLGAEADRPHRIKYRKLTRT